MDTEQNQTSYDCGDCLAKNTSRLTERPKTVTFRGVTVKALERLWVCSACGASFFSNTDCQFVLDLAIRKHKMMTMPLPEEIQFLASRVDLVKELGVSERDVRLFCKGWTIPEPELAKVWALLEAIETD